jgi:hypothetical protein
MFVYSPLRVTKFLNQVFAQPARYHPWPGFRHPCRSDGVAGHNENSWCLTISNVFNAIFERDAEWFYETRNA